MTWTTPATPIALTTVTVTFYNVNIRDNLNHLRGLLPDPGTVGLPLVASSLTAAAFAELGTTGIADLAVTNAKIAAGTIDLGAKAANLSLTNAKIAAGTIDLSAKAVDGSLSANKMATGAAASNLGYAPVSKLGDAMTGSLSIAANNGGPLLTLWQQNGSGFSIAIYNAAQNAFDLFLDHSSMSVGVPTTFGGTAAVTLLSTLTVGGALTGQSTVQGTRLIATVNDSATAPLTIDAAQAGVVVPNLYATRAQTADSANAIANGAVSTAAKIASGIITDAQVAAANKDGTTTTPSLRTLGTSATQAAAGNHTHANMAVIGSSSYAGNNAGSRVIANSLGFTPKKVDFIVKNGGTVVGTATLYSTGDAVQHTISTGLISTAGTGTMDASGFTLTSSHLNNSANTYTWIAFG